MNMKRRDFLRNLGVAGAAAATAAQLWGLPARAGDKTLAVGEDGEGTARLVSPAYVVAGEPTRLIVEVTVGPSGIPVDGGVAIGFHHAASWRPAFQTSAPDKAGYVAITGPDGVAFETVCHEWAPQGMIPKQDHCFLSDAIHHRVLIATVSEKALSPGDVVTFTFNADLDKPAIHAIVDPCHQLRVMTDIDGDGTYAGVMPSPVFDIVPAAPDHLVAFAPAQVVAGQSFEVQVNVEDRFYNLVHDPHDRVRHDDTVTIADEDGAVLAADVAIKRGMARVTLSVPEQGLRRLRLRSAAGLSGRSNPFKAFHVLPEYKIYWGDIHGHTNLSDGLGECAADYFVYGRDVACLDVCALTDHGHFDWEQTKEAARDFLSEGRFITLLAQEAGARSDHVNYYFRHGDTDHVRQWVNDYGTLQALILDQYNSGPEPEVIAGPHHFSYDRGDARYPFGLWDPAVLRFVEVYSSHGTSEFPENPRPVGGPTAPDTKFMQHGLAQGLRFGVIASSDCHDSRPGRTIWGHYPGGLVAFLAKTLTREAVWEAFWNRRTYGTSIDRIYLEFSVDGHPMGSDLQVGGPVKVTYEAAGITDSIEVVLVRNNQEIRRDKAHNGILVVTLDDEPGPGETFYYVRVEQDNGERAWSTPVWVTRA